MQSANLEHRLVVLAFSEEYAEVGLFTKASVAQHNPTRQRWIGIVLQAPWFRHCRIFTKQLEGHILAISNTMFGLALQGSARLRFTRRLRPAIPIYISQLVVVVVVVVVVVGAG